MILRLMARRIWLPEEERVGRSARWPTYVGFVRFRRWPIGVYARIGNRAGYLALRPPARRR